MPSWVILWLQSDGMGYSLKVNLAAPGNYGGSRAATDIRYLVLHYTGNDGDTAEGNGKYFANNVVKASAHYFVDDDSVIQAVPDRSVAWSVGGSKWGDCKQTGGGTMYGIIHNFNSLNVELCDTLKDGQYQASEKTLENAVSLCRQLMKRYEIPITNVYRHFDVTGKHCPAYFMDEAAWLEFKSRLEAPMDNTPRDFAKEAVEWAQKNHILRGDATGNLKLSETPTREELMVFLHRFAQHISEHMSKI